MKLSMSTKHSVVAGELANLTGVVRIRDVANAILRIHGMKEKTLAGMTTTASYDPNDPTVMKIDDLYVDMTYQRILRLQKLLKKLHLLKGFDPYSAGYVDVALRPSGKIFCWDGFRRVIMAALSGLDYIKVSEMPHRQFMTDTDCQEVEARYFKSRNADNENMKAEEIWKAEVVFRDEEALELLDLFKNCEVDVEGLNPSGRPMGGFVEVKNNYFRTDNIAPEYFIAASRIIRQVYDDNTTLSGYLLTGLAYLLMKNEDVDVSYSEEEILEAMRDYARVNSKQTAIIKGRLHNKARESIAYLIAKRALKDDNGLINSFDLDDELEALEESL